MDNSADGRKQWFKESLDEIIQAMESGVVVPHAINIRMTLLLKHAEKMAILAAWESCKQWIESSNIMVCGDAEGTADVKASINFYKQALIKRADQRIKELKRA